MNKGISLPYGLKRLSKGPIDVDSVFETMKDALDYINSPTSYEGQILSIKDKNEWNIYIIDENNKLVRYNNLINLFTWNEI